MTLTLPQSLGGIKTFSSTSALIMRSTDDSIEMFVDVHIDADLVVDDTMTVHANSTFDGDVAIGDKILFNAGAGSLELGALKLNGPIDANDQTIEGGRFETTPGGSGGITMIGDAINFSGSGALNSAGGRIQSTVGMSMLGDTQIGSGFDSASLTVTGPFGCNGSGAQGSHSLGAAATDLASVIVLANNLRSMSINNGTGA